jgi:predicted phosphoribosyltransferase
MEGRFPNRAAAGRELAEKLTAYRGHANAIVLGLPRGGVPVAYEVAARLGLPLDVFVVRKLGVPGYEELAMGAIASGSVLVLNDDVMRALPNSEAMLESVRAREKVELQRRETRYRQDRPAPDLKGRVVILVDDGLATGATMRAAAAALRKQGVGKIVVAVPVGAPETCHEIQAVADETICAIMPPFFHGVGQFYEDFSQTNDDEVRELLAKGRMTHLRQGYGAAGE